jgi:prevent-host-death family protein
MAEKTARTPMAHCRTTGGYDLYVERIGVRELRQHASRYLGRVKAGESIEVTQRGTPVAYLVPAVRDEVRERPVQDGQLIPARGPRLLPEPVEASGPSTAEVLNEPSNR